MDITSAAMLARLAELSAERPEIETLTYIMGPERILEWAHPVGVSTDPGLRDLAPAVPPVQLRSIVAGPSEAVFLWSGLKDAEMCATYLAQLIQDRRAGPVRVLDFG